MTTRVIAERVREAHARRRKLRIAGAGTWLTAGRPVEADETLSLTEDRGIVEYVPGDLTLTARAGTRLSEIIAATPTAGGAQNVRITAIGSSPADELFELGALG